MALLTKNKIGLSIILMAIVCFISLPRLPLTASAQPVNYQTGHDPFNSIVYNPDFSVSASPSYLSTTAGLSVNTTIMVTPRYSFNGTISLSASVPAGWTATFTPSSLSLTNGYYGYYGYYYYGYYNYGSYNWSTLSVAVPSDAAVGKYTVVVTGTSGSLAHSVNVTVNVVAPDFRLYVYPSYLSVSAGFSWNSTALVSSLYGFSGTVSLSASCPSGWTATFAQSELSLTNGYYGYYSYGGSNYSKLSLAVPSDAANGTYTIVVTGTSGSLTHSVNVTVNVVAPDFRLYVYPSRLSVAAGSTWGSSVLVSSLYGFNGTVSLSASVPSGWTASFNPSSLSLTNGYYNCSALSLSVPSDAAAGKYTVVVTGTNGTLAHSANVTVTVGSFDFWRR